MGLIFIPNCGGVLESGAFADSQHLHTLPETNSEFAPENRPKWGSKKKWIIFQPVIFREANLLLCFRKGSFSTLDFQKGCYGTRQHKITNKKSHRFRTCTTTVGWLVGTQTAQLLSASCRRFRGAIVHVEDQDLLGIDWVA